MILVMIVTLCASALAVLAAIFAWRVTRRGSVAFLSSRFDALQLHFATLNSTIEHQEAAIMNLRSRMTMQATRGKRNSETSSPALAAGTATDETEKAATRRALGAQLANGTLKPPGR